MADFVEKSNVKTAVRVLTAPIADVASFDAIVQQVITDNPFGCVAYMSGGVNHPPVEKTQQAYTSRIIYQDVNAKTVGTDTGRYNTVAGFNAGITATLASAEITAAHAGTPARDTENESFSATLRCNSPTGEIYYVDFARDRITLSSYSDDAIRTTVETWADTVAALA